MAHTFLSSFYADTNSLHPFQNLTINPRPVCLFYHNRSSCKENDWVWFDLHEKRKSFFCTETRFDSEAKWLVMVLCLPCLNRFISYCDYPQFNMGSCGGWILGGFQQNYGNSLGLNWRISFTRFPAIALYRPRTFSFAFFSGSPSPYCVNLWRRRSSR